MAAAKKAATPKKKAAPRRSTQKYLRNLRNVHVSLRLREDRKIELAPRGQRGDVTPLKRGDQTDDIFVANQALLFEIITKEEAEKIAESQTTNEQAKPHPALQTIRNERGEVYNDNAVTLDDQPGNASGVGVAPLDAEGNLTIDRKVGIRRAAVPGSADSATEDIPDSVAPENQAAYRKRKS